MKNEAEQTCELSEEWRAEIERRMVEHARDPSTAPEWKEVRARLWSELRKHRQQGFESK